MVGLQEQTTVNSKMVQETFWKNLQQFKFDLCYYCCHYQRCITVTRLIKYVVAGLTTASTLVWMECAEISSVTTICSFVIIALQVFNAVSDLFPFTNRKDELRDLANDLDPLYIEMESTWRKIANGEYTVSEISQMIDEYASKQLQIQKNYLKNDFLKDHKRIVAKAEKQTQEYFENF